MPRRMWGKYANAGHQTATDGTSVSCNSRASDLGPTGNITSPCRVPFPVGRRFDLPTARL